MLSCLALLGIGVVCIRRSGKRAIVTMFFGKDAPVPRLITPSLVGAFRTAPMGSSFGPKTSRTAEGMTGYERIEAKARPAVAQEDG